MKLHDVNSKHKCVCCNKKVGIPVQGENGPWCIYCMYEAYYDGWKPRKIPLTLKQTRKRRYYYND